jgi:hypothetical protein
VKLVRPIAVTVANLTSDVTQPESLWLIGATYSAADDVYEVVDGVPMSFISKAGGNIGHQPSADTAATYWEPMGATNRWRMFDGEVQTQTAQADGIEVEVELSADEALDTVRLANVSALSVQVVAVDAVDGTVYDETFDMTSNVGIDDYLPWFTEPIIRKTGLTLSDLPSLYPGVTVTVTLEAPGEDAACGLCLFGLSRYIGGTKWDSELGFRDLSVKDEDPFGGLFIVERSFKRTASFDITVHSGFVDELQRLLEAYRATPVLFIGDDEYDTMAIYGFVKAFKTQVKLRNHSICSLDLESLA